MTKALDIFFFIACTVFMWLPQHGSTMQELHEGHYLWFAFVVTWTAFIGLAVIVMAIRPRK